MGGGGVPKVELSIGLFQESSQLEIRPQRSMYILRCHQPSPYTTTSRGSGISHGEGGISLQGGFDFGPNLVDGQLGVASMGGGVHLNQSLIACETTGAPILLGAFLKGSEVKSGVGAHLVGGGGHQRSCYGASDSRSVAFVRAANGRSNGLGTSS